MTRRVPIAFLTVLSIVLAVSCMVSHWHAMHFSRVWNQGVQFLDLRGGHMRWFRATSRDQWSSAANWTHTEHSLPGRFVGVSSSNDGDCSVWFPGLRIEWCSQLSGYRRFEVLADFRTLAVIAALYPMLSVVTARGRRYLRARKGLCLHCGYNLKGNISGVCPECGNELDSTSSDTSAP